MSDRIIRSSHKEELKITQETITSPLPTVPLVTFDLNLNTLQEYLNKVVTVVNKNSLSIQTLTQEITQKISTSEGLELAQGIALSIPSELGGKKPRNQTWNEGLSAANSSLHGLCENLQSLEFFKKTTTKKLIKQKKTLKSKLTVEDFEREKREINLKLSEKISKDQFNQKISSLEESIKRAEDRFSLKMQEMEKKISELEVSTLWKIRDCENLLKIRVNEKFVWDALAALEIKMKQEQDSLALSKFKNHESRIEMLHREMKRLEEDLLQKLNESRRLLVDMEKELPKKIDEDKYQHLLNLISCKGPDNHEELHSLSKKLKDLEDKLLTLSYKIPADPYEDISKLTAQGAYLMSELEKRAEREAVIEMFNSLKNAKPTIVQAPIQEVTELWKFRERSLKTFENIEDRFNKLSKAMDLTVIKRALATKANEGQTKEEFISVGQRLIDLEKNQNELAKELDRVNILIKRLYQMIEELGQNSGFALISKKPYVQNCLSCGRGDSTYVATIPHVQGVDGRFYKADAVNYRPAVTSTDWKANEEEDIYHSPAPVTSSGMKLSAVLGKDLVKSLSTKSINPKTKFRPSSARK